MKIRADDLPERLMEEEGPASELLRRFARQTPHAPGENAAWDGTLARLGRDAGRHRGRLIFALVLGAVTGAAALYAALSPHSRFLAVSSNAPAPRVPPSLPATFPTAVTPPAPASSATAPPLTDAPHIQLGRAAVGLPVGVAELVGEAEVTLSREGSARAFATPTAATVELTAGARWTCTSRSATPTRAAPSRLQRVRTASPCWEPRSVSRAPATTSRCR